MKTQIEQVRQKMKQQENKKKKKATSNVNSGTVSYQQVILDSK